MMRACRWNDAQLALHRARKFSKLADYYQRRIAARTPSRYLNHVCAAMRPI